ncbi:hypothetical protein FOZ62_024875, partial [Perkinsus olseni]
MLIRAATPLSLVNITLAASSCLKDDSGSASYVRRVLQGGSAVVHRQLFSGVGDDCDAKVHRSLLVDSRVPNSIESCMEVVYGADPESRRVGSGYCKIQSGEEALVALLSCLQRDWGPLITRHVASELGMPINTTIEEVAEELMSSAGVEGKCVGPKVPLESQDTQLASGNDTAEECILRSPQACNWNVNIATREVCEDNYETDSSSCRPTDEQWSYQQNSPSVCTPVSEISDGHCWEAFNMLVETTEEKCLNSATTSEAAQLCEGRRRMHTQWLTDCITNTCNMAETLSNSGSLSAFMATSYIDQHCTVTGRDSAMLCMDSCRETSGPQPVATRECYRPMGPTETEQDCLNSIEGDASVHYRVDDGVEVPTSGSAFEIDEMMRSPHPQPAYCSVRTFVKGRTKVKLEDKEAADRKLWEAFTLWEEERREVEGCWSPLTNDAFLHQSEEAAITEQYPA